MGVRGLKEVKATIQAEKQGVDEYVWEKKDSEPPLQVVWEARNEGTLPMTKKDWGKIWCNKTNKNRNKRHYMGNK